MLHQVFRFNKTDLAWHLPVAAGLCIGTPLVAGVLDAHIKTTEETEIAMRIGLFGRPE